MAEREYQLAVKDALARIYREVAVQWHPFVGQGRNIYSPAIDVAVGPFAVEERLEAQYTRLLEKSRNLIQRFVEAHNHNVEDTEEQTSFEGVLHFNENARCLIAIEIENTGSKKHCIGDLVNASALGRIGLLVAWSPGVFRTFLRQRVYLGYLARVGKNTFRTDNALVLTKEQFDECLGSVAH
jgi:hypothetical protein